MLIPQTTEQLSQISLVELIDYIEATHHAYIRETAPLLIEYTEKMVRAHGDDHDEIRPLAKCVRELIDELIPHLMKEEQILFPAIKSLSLGQPINGCFGHIGNPINMMLHEHDNADIMLDTIRNLTNNYTIPADVCQTWQACYRTLAEFDADLQTHIDVENTLLFPKALAL